MLACAFILSLRFTSLFLLGWTMLACLTCSFFVDYPPSIEQAYLFETPSPFRRRSDCLVSVPPESADCTSPPKSTDTVVMDLLKRFKRTVKDQSRTKSNNNNNDDQALGGGGQWNYPARLYYPIGDTRDSDSSDNSNCSDISTGTGTGTKYTSSIDSHNHDADDEASVQSLVQSFEALQFEASVEASASSVLIGELAFENMSMVYSEDGENSTTSSAVSNISALSSQLSLDGIMEHTSTGFKEKNAATPTPNQSSSSATAANVSANASCLNMLQLQDRHESDDESLLSEATSIFSPDHYFLPQEEEANEVTDNDSNEEETSDNYIFTDDKSDPPSPPIERLSVAESAALARLCSLEPEQEEEKKEPDHHDDSLSPTAWSPYNSARGRKVAKALTQNMGDNNTALADGGDTEDEDETMQTSNTSYHRHNHHRPSSRRTGSTDKRTSSMLGHAVKSLRRKRYTPSSSPLDFQHPPKANKQEDAAVSKSLLSSSTPNTTASPDPAMSSSAVYARNALVDFGSWEARVSRPTIPNASAAATTTATPTTGTTAKAKRAPLSVQLPEEEEQDSLVEPCVVVTPTGVKVMSLFSSGTPSPPSISRQNNDLDTSALESPRTLADDILQSLGLAGDDHARQCLQTLRARAGVIDDLECDQQGADEDPSNILPWMHIVDDVWMPHYEEYVFTTVHAFHRRLLGPSV
jgi:hypothetical protein